MRWITAVVAGLVVGFGATYVTLSSDRPDVPAAVRAEVSAESPSGVGSAPDTTAAESAGCGALREMGSAGTIGDWINVSYVLDGTRLGREAAAVRKAAGSGSRSATYGAVLDVLEACLALGV